MTCDHSASQNPRRSNTCVKCGRIMPPVPERDRKFETGFLDDVEGMATALGVPADGAFRGLVFYRTDGAGARNYGDTSFLTDDRDLLREAREEAGDGGVYPMFHCEKQGYEPGHEVRHWLAAAGAHFAAADWCIRMARQVEDAG